MADERGQKPVVLFVELEDWERQFLIRGEDKVWDGLYYSERLEQLSKEQIPSNVSILSTFVHSNCSAGVLARLPGLKAIATRSTGFDHIELDYCQAKGIAVSNVPSYGDNTVAEHTFGLILALTRKIHRCYERTVRGDFSLSGLRGQDLQGKVFGCVGTGRIGLNTLRIAGGFDMTRLAYDPHPNVEAAARLGFEYVDWDTLLAQSQVVSLHVPLNASTFHMINQDALMRLPKGAIMINTSRGGLVDTSALLLALKSGHLGGAGLDVMEGEEAIMEEAELLTHEYDEEKLKSVVRNNALLRMENVIITPHVAFNSDEAVTRILQTTLVNIEAIVAGSPENRVV